jgi:hypothetical protein
VHHSLAGREPLIFRHRSKVTIILFRVATMRRKTPIRWIEEAEARRMLLLYDAESKPAPTEADSGPELLLVTKATLTVLVSKMTGRIARTARARPSAGEEDSPADGCEGESSSWIAIGCGGAPYRIARASSAGAAPVAYAAPFAREASLLPFSARGERQAS